MYFATLFNFISLCSNIAKNKSSLISFWEFINLLTLYSVYRSRLHSEENIIKQTIDQINSLKEYHEELVNRYDSEKTLEATCFNTIDRDIIVEMVIGYTFQLILKMKNHGTKKLDIF